MSDEIGLARAREVLETFCAMMEHQNLKYKKKEEELSLSLGIQGEDLPIDLLVKIDAQRKLICLYSLIYFAIKDEKRMDLAIAISAINQKLAVGSFDYNRQEGRVLFRCTSSFADSMIGEEAMKYLLFGTIRAVDQYNDQLLMLSKGMFTLEQFLNKLEEEQK